jgi:hypothetical protein
MLDWLLFFASLLATNGGLSGQVLEESSRAPVVEATVEILREGLDPSRAKAARPAGRVKTDDLGHFLFPLLEGGAYSLVVTVDEQEAAAPPSLLVAARGMTLLPGPILVGSDRLLEVFLSPVTDPYGQPWRLHLLRRTGERSLAEVPELEERASPGGDWVAAVKSGEYRLRIEDSTRSLWHQETVTVADEELPVLEISIPYVPVEGRVSFADGDPVVGILWFGGRHGEQSLRIDTDDEGQFVGVVPEAGEWVIDLEREDLGLLQHLGRHRVSRPEGHPFGRLELELPDTHLRGRAVDDRGLGVEAIPVMIVDPAARRHHRIQTDSEGSFELRGIAPGLLLVRAEAPGVESAWARVHLQEKLDPPILELVLVGQTLVRGSVTSGGRAVSGAQIRAMVRSSLGASETVDATTDPAGRFEIEVPSGSVALDLLVLPPGYAASAFHVVLAGEEITSVDLAVEPAGGTLEVALGEVDEPMDLLFVTNGTMIPATFFEYWASFAGGGRDDGRWTIPRLASGEYAVCLRSARGRLQCDTGVLVAGGTLVLRPSLEADESIAVAELEERSSS